MALPMICPKIHLLVQTWLNRSLQRTKKPSLILNLKRLRQLNRIQAQVLMLRQIKLQLRIQFTAHLDQDSVKIKILLMKNNVWWISSEIRCQPHLRMILKSMTLHRIVSSGQRATSASHLGIQISIESPGGTLIFLRRGMKVSNLERKSIGDQFIPLVKSMILTSRALLKVQD